MKNKIYHTVGTVLKSKLKNICLLEVLVLPLSSNFQCSALGSLCSSNVKKI